MRRKVTYYAVVALTVPLLLLAVVAGVAEAVLGTGGTLALRLACPFLWAVDRDRETA